MICLIKIIRKIGKIKLKKILFKIQNKNKIITKEN